MHGEDMKLVWDYYYYYASETNLRATPILEPSSSHHLCITWGCSILLFLTR